MNAQPWKTISLNETTTGITKRAPSRFVPGSEAVVAGQINLDRTKAVKIAALEREHAPNSEGKEKTTDATQIQHSSAASRTAEVK